MAKKHPFLRPIFSWNFYWGLLGEIGETTLKKGLKMVKKPLFLGYTQNWALTRTPKKGQKTPFFRCFSVPFPLFWHSTFVRQLFKIHQFKWLQGGGLRNREGSLSAPRSGLFSLFYWGLLGKNRGPAILHHYKALTWGKTWVFLEKRGGWGFDGTFSQKTSREFCVSFRNSRVNRPTEGGVFRGFCSGAGRRNPFFEGFLGHF